MTASTRWTLSRPSLSTALIWSLLPAFGAACGLGGEVDMGNLTLAGGSGAGGGGGSSMCGSQPCADFRGTRVFVEPSAADAPVDSFVNASVHPNGTDPSLESALLYPNHETMVPIDLSQLRFTWSTAKSTLFALDFKGTNTEVRVVTRDPAWVPDATEWDWIAESNRGHDVKVVVRGIAPNQPGDVWSSREITLSFSPAAVGGAIYYWSTGSKGVMKALLSDPISQKFYTDPAGADSTQCTGCHALSRDGKRLAASYEDGSLRVVSVPERQVLLSVNGGTAGGTEPPVDMKMMPADKAAWTTFSPDGSLLLVASGGKLTLFDVNTGMPVGAGAVASMPGMLATHPDWSGLGDQVAVTLASKGGGKSTEGGSIWVLPYSAGSFGTPQVIVQSQGGADNNYFPTFSPDSRFIAYVNASGKSEDAKSASLRMVEVSSGKVIELTRLNQRVNNQDALKNLGNSMPTWAPSTTPGVFWLAFSSLREYADLRLPDKKLDQIWLAAIDPSRPDPSYAALWAPFQSIEQGNHRAFWTHDLKDDRLCHCVEVCGDGIDNDCDGSADEAGCRADCAEREECDDGVDNDCNCLVDDCNVEDCTDGVDTDGDGRADAEDPACMAH
jgi:hypothetical protein